MRLLNSILMLAATVCGLFSNASYAAWTTPGKVVYVNMWADGFAFIIEGQNETCPNSGAPHFYVPAAATEMNSKQIYAMVLSAFYTGDYIAADASCDAYNRKVTRNVDIRKAP